MRQFGLLNIPLTVVAGRRNGERLLAATIILASICPLSSGGMTTRAGSHRAGSHRASSLQFDKQKPILRNYGRTVRDEVCLQECHCAWREEDLVSITCLKDMKHVDCDAIRSSTWPSLETLHLEGQSGFDCIASTAFTTAHHSLRNLTLKNIRLPDILSEVSCLHNLRAIAMINVGLHSESDFSAIGRLDKLEFLDLSQNDFKNLDLDFLLQWSETLTSFKVNGCRQLKAVTMVAKEELKYRGARLLKLRDVTISHNPGLNFVCKWLLRSSPNVRTVDFSQNPALRIHPSSLFPRHVNSIDLSGSDFPFCDCHISLFSITNLGEGPCYVEGSNDTISFDAFLSDKNNCFNSVDYPPANENVTVAYPNEPVALSCGNTSGKEFVSWITPINEIRLKILDPSATKQSSNQCWPRHDLYEEECVPPQKYFVMSRVVYTSDGYKHSQILENGSLLIPFFGWRDRGKYRCMSWSRGEDLSVADFSSHNISVSLGVEYRQTLYNLSLIYGLATAGTFLLITLTTKLVYFVLHNYGCCLFCCCCKDQLPPKARKLKNALDSIEAYRTQQQDKLRENYHQQTEWIRQNCAVQMERVRDNYNNQIQNLRDIRQYGSVQLQGVRDQYYEQMQRIRDYSTSQLERVHENYIFQRQKLRKFSAQNYLKMRETKNYTRKTMNKVMETIPALYLDLTACRQGLGPRQASLEWEKDDTDVVEVIGPQQYRLRHSKSANQVHKDPKVAMINRRSESVYFTPSGTPLREVQSNSPSKSVPRSRGDLYREVYEHHHGTTQSVTEVTDEFDEKSPLTEKKPFIKHRGKSKSFSSHFLQNYWFGSASSNAKENDTTLGVHTSVVIEHEASTNDYLDLQEGEVTDHETNKNDVGDEVNSKPLKDVIVEEDYSIAASSSGDTKETGDPVLSSNATRITNLQSSDVGLDQIQRSLSQMDVNVRNPLNKQSKSLDLQSVA